MPPEIDEKNLRILTRDLRTRTSMALNVMAADAIDALLVERDEVRRNALKLAADVALGCTYGDDAYDAIGRMYLTPAEQEQMEYGRLVNAVANLRGEAA